jgi:WD40 repeat protein
MNSSAIRHLACARSSSIMAAGFFENTVQIWDLKTLEKASEFETVLSFGGNRPALDPAGEWCVAAAWEGSKRGGVVCYDVKSGRPVWHRSALKQTQRVRFSTAGDSIWWVSNRGPVKRHAAETGDTLDTLTGVSDIFDSQYSANVLRVKNKRECILKGRPKFKIPRFTFGVLDAVFSRDAVCISEAGGTVRCFEASDGRERGQCNPGLSQHVLRLWHRDVDDSFYGVRWDYCKGSFRTLVRMSAQTGECLDVGHLNSWEEEVCPALGCLITSHGELLHLDDGRLLNRIQFPLTDYPDQPAPLG